MSAEVFPETAYVADCDDCGYQSELFEERSDAQRHADLHNETCTNGGDPDDPCIERERFQDQMDDIVRRAYANTERGFA